MEIFVQLVLPYVGMSVLNDLSRMWLTLCYFTFKFTAKYCS